MIGSTRTREPIRRKSSEVGLGLLIGFGFAGRGSGRFGWSAKGGDDRPPSDSGVLVLDRVLLVGVGVERVVRPEEEVAEAHGGVLAAHRPALAAGQVLEVGRLLAQHADQGLAPGGVAAER